MAVSVKSWQYDTLQIIFRYMAARIKLKSEIQHLWMRHLWSHAAVPRLLRPINTSSKMKSETFGNTHALLAHPARRPTRRYLLNMTTTKRKPSSAPRFLNSVGFCVGSSFLFIHLYLSFPPTDWLGNKEGKTPGQHQHQATTFIIFTWLLMRRQEHNINQLGTNSFGARQTTDQFLESSFLNCSHKLQQISPQHHSVSAHWGLTPAVRMAFRGQTRSSLI